MSRRTPCASTSAVIPRPNRIKSRKRRYHDRETYDPAKEVMPALPDFSMNPEELRRMAGEACDEICASLEQHESIDPRVKVFTDALQKAKTLSGMSGLSIAILGEQASGKSSLLNAILDRSILDTGGGVTACTRFAIVLIFKPGAPDNANMSDIKIRLFSEKAVERLVKEQAQNWTEYYPGMLVDDRHDDSEDEHSEDDDASNSHVRVHLPCVQSQTNAPKKETPNATTARQFFEFVFCTREDEEKRKWLHHALKTTNIEETDFIQLCIIAAMKKLRNVARKIGANDDGVAIRRDQSDTKWADTRIELNRVWPFVKVVTIFTGHILLRNGIRLFDLPGYSDTSQLREVVINDFRRKADFEVVVAPLARSLTNTLQEKYLHQSLDIVGENRTILVLNKCDEAANESNIVARIAEIDDEPFRTWHEQLQQIDMPEKNGQKLPPDLLDSEKILDLALGTYIQREAELVRDELSDLNGIKVFTTSALVYLSWKNSRRREEWPSLSASQTGIPALRQFLYSLHSRTNFSNYRKYIFVDIPALIKTARPILVKHTEDESYVNMRTQVDDANTSLVEQLRTLSLQKTDPLILNLWGKNQEWFMNKQIEDVIHGTWYHPDPVFSGFLKMLREGGKPRDGAYVGRNLNKELLDKVLIGSIDKWLKKMVPRAETLREILEGPIHIFYEEFQRIIGDTSVATPLKKAAMETLEDIQTRLLTASEDMYNHLDEALVKTYRRYANEVDVDCPIAKIMRPIYVHALNPQITGSGKGVFRRMLWAISSALASPPTADGPHGWVTPMQPLLSTFQENLLSQQKGVWHNICEEFAEEVDSCLTLLSQLLRNLPAVHGYATPEHKKLRKDLERFLSDFETKIGGIQKQFDGVMSERPRKRTKLMDDDDDADLDDDDADLDDDDSDLDDDDSDLDVDNTELNADVEEELEDEADADVIYLAWDDVDSEAQEQDEGEENNLADMG